MPSATRAPERMKLTTAEPMRPSWRETPPQAALQAATLKSKIAHALRFICNSFVDKFGESDIIKDSHWTGHLMAVPFQCFCAGISGTLASATYFFTILSALDWEGSCNTYV